MNMLFSVRQSLLILPTAALARAFIVQSPVHISSPSAAGQVRLAKQAAITKTSLNVGSSYSDAAWYGEPWRAAAAAEQGAKPRAVSSNAKAAEAAVPENHALEEAYSLGRSLVALSSTFGWCLSEADAVELAGYQVRCIPELDTQTDQQLQLFDSNHVGCLVT
jgi:hypothetical protein